MSWSMNKKYFVWRPTFSTNHTLQHKQIWESLSVAMLFKNYNFSYCFQNFRGYGTAQNLNSEGLKYT